MRAVESRQRPARSCARRSSPAWMTRTSAKRWIFSRLPLLRCRWRVRTWPRLRQSIQPQSYVIYSVPQGDQGMPDAATNPNLSEDCLSDFWRTPDHETSIHIFRYTSGALDFPEHCHGEFSINIALEHPLSYRVGNSVETVERGKALIIRPGEWHAGVYPLHRAPLGLTISVTECALKLLLQKMGTNLDLEKTQINLSRIAEDSRLLPLAEEMAHEIQGRAPGRHVVMASLLTLFLTLLL